MNVSSKWRSASSLVVFCFLVSAIPSVPYLEAGGGLADQDGQGTLNGLTPNEVKEGWRLLFDGKTTRGWRAYKGDTVPSGWQVVDGALVRVAPAADIVTVDEFADFELHVEWRVAEGANSGIFYRAIDGLEWIYHGAPEYQILDDARHRDGRSPLTSAGAVYGLYPAKPGVVKPAGEWNVARIVARGPHVEHWLNGVKVAEYEQGSADWQARVEASKFAQWPQFGKAMKGRIGLQEHGGRVEFRNIKIRPLE